MVSVVAIIATNVSKNSCGKKNCCSSFLGSSNGSAVMVATLAMLAGQGGAGSKNRSAAAVTQTPQQDHVMTLLGREG